MRKAYSFQISKKICILSKIRLSFVLSGILHLAFMIHRTTEEAGLFYTSLLLSSTVIIHCQHLGIKRDTVESSPLYRVSDWTEAEKLSKSNLSTTKKSINEKLNKKRRSNYFLFILAHLILLSHNIFHQYLFYFQHQKFQSIFFLKKLFPFSLKK